MCTSRQDDTDLVDKLAREGNTDELCVLLGARGGELTFLKDEIDYECGPYDDWPKRIEFNRYTIGAANATVTTLATALAGNVRPPSRVICLPSSETSVT